MEESIELNGKKYPIRFDFRALKEFKFITGEDVLSKFDPKNTDNIITLTFVALKSGYFFMNPNATEFLTTIEDVSRMLSMRDMKKVIAAFLNEVGVLAPDAEVEKTEVPGEIPGTVLRKPHLVS